MNVPDILKPLSIDSGDPVEIGKLYELGFINGATTNPSLCVKAGFRSHREIEEALIKLSRQLNNPQNPIPISIEQDVHLETTAEQMIEEGIRLHYLFSENIVVKIPVWPFPACYQAIEALSSEGIPVNATLVFQWKQAVRATAAELGIFLRVTSVANISKPTAWSFILIQDIMRT